MTTYTKRLIEAALWRFKLTGEAHWLQLAQGILELTNGHLPDELPN